MDGSRSTRAASVAAHLAASCVLGLIVWLAFGRTAFVNYDSAWSLDWMRQLVAGGSRPDLERLFSPTPHPLSDLFSAVLVPLSDSGGPAVGRGAETGMIVAALFWIGALGVVTFRLGAAWFGTAAGAVAAVLVLTREPVLSYGLRTYLDLPYAVFLLLALLAETRRPRNGARTIAWITLAGLLRPEAWLLAAAYVAYLVVFQVRGATRPDGPRRGGSEDDEGPLGPWAEGRSGNDTGSLDSQTAGRSGNDTGSLDSQTGGRSGNDATSLDSQTAPRSGHDPVPAGAPTGRLSGASGEAGEGGTATGPRAWIAAVDVRPLLPLIALSLVAPVGWIVEGLVLTGDPLQALTGTQQNAADLDRVTGVGSAITVMPRRLGEIVREPVLLAALGGALLSLTFLRRRAALASGALVAAGVAFFVLAAAGLPLLTRYLVFPATLLIVFAAAGLLGWRHLDADHRWRRPWQAFAVVALLAFVVFLPGQERRLDRLQTALALQQRVIGDLRTVTGEVVAPTLTEACRPATATATGNALTLFGDLDGVPAGERGDPVATAERLFPAVALPNHRAVPQVVLWLGRGDGDRPLSVQALASTAAGLGKADGLRGGSETSAGGPAGPAVTLLPSSERVARGFILDKADGDDGLPSAPAGSVRAGTLGTWSVYGRDARCAAALRARLPG